MLAVKFLADECCDSAMVKAMRSYGCDVVYAVEILRGAGDDQVLQHAYDDGRILLTEDKDFGELVYRLRKPARGIVLMRFGIAERHLKLSRLKKLIDEFDNRIAGSFIVIDKEKFRFRPLVFKM